MGSNVAEIMRIPASSDAVLDESGLHAVQDWSVLAGSDVEAIRLLKDVKGLTRGSVYTTPAGEIVDQFLTCQRIRGQTKQGGQGLIRKGHIHIVAEFSDATMIAQAAKPGGPPVWTIRPTIASSPVDIDAQGKPILTDSLEPVDPPLTVLLPDEVLHAEFYIASTDCLRAYFPFRPFNGKLNDAYLPLLAAPRGSLLCHVFQPEPSDTGWIKFAVDFQYRAPKLMGNGITYEGWSDVFQDKGRRKRVEGITNTTPLNEAFELLRHTDGSALQMPVPLNAAGQPATWGDFIAGNMKLSEVHNYKYANFSRIPFPK